MSQLWVAKELNHRATSRCTRMAPGQGCAIFEIGISPLSGILGSRSRLALFCHHFRALILISHKLSVVITL